MNIQRFQRVSHINYGCIDMPECSISLLARPGEKFKDLFDWHSFTRKIKATDYIYSFGAWDYGTADDVIKFYEHQINCEFSKTHDRHIFRFRPWADVHFLDGSVQTVYFNNTDEIINFSQQMNVELGLDKHILLDGNNFVGVDEMRPFEDQEVVNK